MKGDACGSAFLNSLKHWIDKRSALQLITLTFVAGLLSALSFAPVFFFPILFVSYPFLLLVIFGKSRSSMEAFSLGWWFSFGQFYAGLYWIANSFVIQEGVSGLMGIGAVGILAGLLALFGGLVTYAVHRFYKDKPFELYMLPIVLSFVVCWNIGEWLRGHLFHGLPWNLAGYSAGFSDMLLQSTALWGAYGLGLVVMFLAFVPFLIASTSLKSREGKSVLGVALILITGLLIYGSVRLQGKVEFVEDVVLKLVQPNISQKDKWDREKRTENFLDYLSMSRNKSGDKATHVIWPETAAIYALDSEPSRRYLIADMLGEDAVLLTGYLRVERVPEFKVWTSFMSIDAQGKVGDIYDKSRLVPFGEYTPAPFRFLMNLVGMGSLFQSEFTPGSGIKTITVPGLPSLSVLICYEINFPTQVVDKNDRPEWILNITNDAWYGQSSGPYQHFLQTRIRAIEEGLPVVRSAGTGISAIIDPYGRTLQKLPLNSRGVVQGKLPLKLDKITPYARIRDWLFGCMMFVILLVILMIQRYRGVVYKKMLDHAGCRP